MLSRADGLVCRERSAWVATFKETSTEWNPFRQENHPEPGATAQEANGRAEVKASEKRDPRDGTTNSRSFQEHISHQGVEVSGGEFWPRVRKNFLFFICLLTSQSLLNDHSCLPLTWMPAYERSCV